MREGWVALPTPHPPPPLDLVVEWLEGRVSAAAPALGRPGALCPFVPDALQRRAIFAKLVDGAQPVEALVELVLAESEGLRAAAACPHHGRPEALLLVAPAASGERLRALRIAAKPALLRRGLTCGEFYPGSNDRSARNDAARVAEAPVGCLAIRSLTPHDELFLRPQGELFTLFEEWMRTHGE